MTTPPAPGPITVAIVDDDPLVRSGLALVLGGQPDIHVVGEADDGDAVLSLVTRTDPDIVVMDIRMRRTDGVAAARALLQHGARTRVLVLTTLDSGGAVRRALAAGARGYLLKADAPRRLVEAVRAVHEGDLVLSPSVTEWLVEAVAGADADDRRRQARSRLGALSDREREVADLVGRGWSNARIGDALDISLATTKAHVSAALTRTHCDNRVELALLVRDSR